MAPDSLGVELLAVALTVAAAVALAVGWNAAAGYRRIMVRILLLIVCLSTTAASGLVWLNRQVDLYTSWSSLVSTSTGTVAPSTGAAQDHPTGGRIISFTVAGRASAVTLPVYAYLPAAYDTEPTVRFPVIEALHGYPGSPVYWQTRLQAVSILDREIAAGRMAPTVVLFPYQTPKPLLDTECANLTHGPKMETFLTVDVPGAAEARLRIRTDRAGWGLTGFSAGGYCATDLLLRHPTEYAAGASLAGYADPGIKIGDGSERTGYDDAWRLRHLPIPAVALYLACARTDLDSLHATVTLAHLARPPMSLTTAYLNGGGHNAPTWLAMEAPAFDWLSTWLGRPTPILG